MDWNAVSNQALTILGHSLVVVIPYTLSISTIKASIEPISISRQIKYYLIWFAVTLIGSVLITKNIKDVDNLSGLLAYFIPAYFSAILGIREGISKDKRMNINDRLNKISEDQVSKMKGSNHSDDRF